MRKNNQLVKRGQKDAHFTWRRVENASLGEHVKKSSVKRASQLNACAKPSATWKRVSHLKAGIERIISWARMGKPLTSWTGLEKRASQLYACRKMRQPVVHVSKNGYLDG